VNLSSAPPDAHTGDERYETLLEMFCAATRYVPDLTDGELVTHAADDLIDQVSHPLAVAEFRAVSAVAEIHSEATILAFLRQLLAELDRRRPWPEPAALDPDR
jgi:hypothetical protein